MKLPHAPQLQVDEQAGLGAQVRGGVDQARRRPQKLGF